MCTAIDFFLPHVRDLNAVFEEYDVYEGRIFYLWELKLIFEQKMTDANLDSLAKAHIQAKGVGSNKAVPYKFIYDTIVGAPQCPVKFKDDDLKRQQFSIYQNIDHLVQSNPDLMNLIQELLKKQVMAGGRCDQAFDEFFGLSTGVGASAKPVRVDVDLLRKQMPALNLNSSYSEKT